jgi:uncharacterized protein
VQSLDRHRKAQANWKKAHKSTIKTGADDVHRPKIQQSAQHCGRKVERRGWPERAAWITKGPATVMTAAQLTPILMLLASNVFMTFAWYGHLKYTSSPLWIAILASWGIALFEYCLAVPANRWGSVAYSTAELKTMQEVITLIVFAAFSVLYLGERLTINHAIGFALICAGAFFVFKAPIRWG